MSSKNFIRRRRAVGPRSVVRIMPLGHDVGHDTTPITLTSRPRTPALTVRSLVAASAAQHDTAVILRTHRLTSRNLPSTTAAMLASWDAWRRLHVERSVAWLADGWSGAAADGGAAV